jgi:hypothetical protein
MDFVQRMYARADHVTYHVDMIYRGKQYKTQIKHWGLEKNVKGREMEAIVRIKRKRKEMEGKESNFTVRNRAVPSKKIMRYMERTNTAGNAPLSQPSPAGENYTHYN